MNSAEDPERLLRDERERRLELERSLAAEQDRTALWRKRAEERSARIERLTGDLDRSPKLRSIIARRFRTSPPDSSPPAPPPLAKPEDGQRTLLAPTLAVAALVSDPGHVAVRDVARRVAEDSWSTADLVVVDGAWWRQADEQRQRALEELASTVGRPPIIGWGKDVPGEIVDTVVDLDPTYFPTPVPGDGSDGDRGSSSDIAAALAGLPIAGAAGDPDRAAVASRRWGIRHHAPWVRLRQLLDIADVPAPDFVGRSAAVIVTNRPHRVAPAIESMRSQSVPVEIVLVLHGIEPVRGTSLDGVTTVIRAREDATLGECLNLGIAETGAHYVAKIDDDDHYGRAFIEDSVATLMASGADVTGKSASYVHLASKGQIVARRVGDAYRPISGTAPGGSLVFRHAAWEAVPFPHRPRYVDKLFLEGVRAAGIPTLAGHRFEFCLDRHGGGHTFDADDVRFTAGADEVVATDDMSYVDVGDLER